MADKQKIREKYADWLKRRKEGRVYQQQLNNTNFSTSSLPAYATGKNRIQALKDNARQAVRDIRNGHADWHEPYWEHDNTALWKALGNYQKKKREGK